LATELKKEREKSRQQTIFDTTFLSIKDPVKQTEAFLNNFGFNFKFVPVVPADNAGKKQEN
jgi:hypothetical protein